jgi:glycerophosphoryl diester phosphodiesterase
VFAHRGLALNAPENTLLAFRAAIDAGASHIETDVHASRDGVAVISHDPDVGRLAGRNVRVEDLTMVELSRLELGHGQTFCSLADALREFPAARFNIDVKTERAEAPTAAAILASNAIDRVLITAFSEGRRRRTADALPGVATSASVSRFLPALLGARLRLSPAVRRSLHGLHAVQVPERNRGMRVVSPAMVRAMHSAGVEVHVWTVNDPDDMRRLLGWGVDGLVTDRCDLAVDVIRSGL